MPRKGLALIAIIIIILFVAIAALGVTGFIANRFVGFNVSERLLRCTYNAQAGIHYAIYQYRASATNFSGTINVGGDAANTAAVTTTGGGGGGGAASNIVINATATTLTNSNRRVSNWTIQNNSASPITINQVTITWQKTPKTLTSLVFNNVTRWSGSDSTSPGVCPTNFTIPANTTYSTNNRVIFNSSVAGDAGVTISFRCSDNSTTTPCTLYPAQPSACSQGGGSLTIQSTGRTTGSTLYKTIEATYNTSTGVISDYKEITTAVP